MNSRKARHQIDIFRSWILWSWIRQLDGVCSCVRARRLFRSAGNVERCTKVCTKRKVNLINGCSGTEKRSHRNYAVFHLDGMCGRALDTIYCDLWMTNMCAFASKIDRKYSLESDSSRNKKNENRYLPPFHEGKIGYSNEKKNVYFGAGFEEIISFRKIANRTYAHGGEEAWLGRSLHTNARMRAFRSFRADTIDDVFIHVPVSSVPVQCAHLAHNNYSACGTLHANRR